MKGLWRKTRGSGKGVSHESRRLCGGGEFRRVGSSSRLTSLEDLESILQHRIPQRVKVVIVVAASCGESIRLD